MLFRRLFLLSFLVAVIVVFLAKVILVINSRSTPPQPVTASSDFVLPEPGVVMDVTGFTNRPEETDDTPCTGARNVDICARHAQGENLCASNAFALGSTVHIEGLGTCTVVDHMNARYTTGIDWNFGVGKDALLAAKAFGRQERLVSPAPTTP